MGYQVDTDGDRSADSIVDVYRVAEVDELEGTIRLTEYQGEETGGSTNDFFMNISDVNISTLEEPPVSFARLSQIIPGRLVFRCEAGNCINQDVIYWEDGEEWQISEASFYCRSPAQAAFHFEELRIAITQQTFGDAGGETG